MDFSWDEAKREWVLAQRGVDFLLVAFALFDGRPLLTAPTPRDDEDRFLSVGPIEGRFFAVVWMWHDGALRIIYGEEGERGGRKTVPFAIRLNRFKPRLRGARTGRIGRRLTP